MVSRVWERTAVPWAKQRAGIPSPSTAIFLFFLNFGFIAAAAKAKPSNLAASAFL